MNNHKMDTNVQWYGCLALGCLTEDFANNEAELMNMGAEQAIIDAMNNHKMSD